jgi:uncharacterized protein
MSVPGAPMTDHGAVGGLPSARPLAPVTARERVVTLDILRGIALLGVVIANVWLWFSGIFFLLPGIRDELVRLSLDAVVFNAIGILVAGKAVSTFSFLFGLGFAVQMLRAEERGVAIAPVYLRRLAVLLLFGAVHGFLLWYGDILMLYAVLGVVLLLSRRRADRTLLVGAGLLLVLLPLALGAVPLIMSLLGRGVPAVDMAVISETNAATLAAFQSGVPAHVFAANLGMLQYMYLSPPAISWTAASLGLFLLGLYAGRRRYFHEVEAHRAGFIRVAVWGGGVGMACSLGLGAMYIRFSQEALAAQPALALLMAVLATFGVVPLAFGYIATATLLVQTAAWQRRLAHFAPVGRMALTNYLSQTVLCLLIFYGYGAGLIGQAGAAASLVIALLIFALQMAWSPWWLARFHFGPAEWVWRTLTYGEVQRMRIAEPVPLPAHPHLPG